MLFLSNRQMIHKNLFQKMAVQPVPVVQHLRDKAGHELGTGMRADELVKMPILLGPRFRVRGERIHACNNCFQVSQFFRPEPPARIQLAVILMIIRKEFPKTFSDPTKRGPSG